eukprot:TRINITY_DN22201_c0_g2_i1.p1 TRINITY_DN22201_c0_g2~~TRINITY_DN22201_c0_g2_i1.p1  ORF type:complete len:103 (-),score=30.53 TRINITY_DN22201_c0_g2_i1:39-347(-)
MGMDHAVFGSLSILKSGLVFISAQSAINPFGHEYGPLESMRVVLEPMKKVWRYKEITQIIIRRYNLLKQAVEIFLKNGKSIFFVIYPMHLSLIHICRCRRAI